MEKFTRFSVSTPGDALASKGALGVVLDRGKDVIILVNTHLDAGDDSDVRLAQLKVVADVVADLEGECSSKGLRVAATVMTGDWNINGTGRDCGASLELREVSRKAALRAMDTTTSSSCDEGGRPTAAHSNAAAVYAQVRDFLGKAGFQDVWQLYADKKGLPRPPSYEGDWAELSVESLAQYGITTDQAIPSCPKRLDYLWVKTGVASPAEEGVAVAGNRPTAEGCLTSTSARSSSSSQEVMMVTIARPELWRADLALRRAFVEAMLSADREEERALRRQINSRNANRTSDHASLVGRIRLLSSEAPFSREKSARQGRA
ncbi:sphingomyelin phosphodiesterase 3, neutral membrane (neutral sphingomyelinase II) [Perkinsus olseni]|uniref:Sphingomyelin phosphodiesterase 3, neutral membrane (Neutral sphingomyelinase II) n=1 Tax=Perkinsus olseni TaxID=32597 RepID=A0A7J6N6S7_PEROL|nr:sphingomyelin phosphodiesterase 3, neutral membrane (neutral sphingomyelinase II) [Perkinsus olseni]